MVLQPPQKFTPPWTKGSHNDALHSTIAGHTRQPPRNTDPDFERRRRFAPRLWWRRRQRFFVVVALSSSQNDGYRHENAREKGLANESIHQTQSMRAFTHRAH